MEDPNETRKAASNWREYLKDSAEGFRVYAWAWREFITPESRKYMKLGVAALMLGSVLAMVQPWFVRGLIDGLVGRDGHRIVTALIAIAVAMIVDRLLTWAFDHYREHASGIDLGRVDVHTTEMFFDKSLGQHLRDDGVLTASNIEKGRNRVIDVEHLLVYEAVPTLARLLLAFVFLTIVAPVAGVAMGVLFAIYMMFMLFMNVRVLRTGGPIDAEFRRFNRHRVERLDNIERVKTNGKEKEEIGHMSSSFDDIIGRDRRFWHWVIRVATVRSMINGAFTVLLMGYGAWRVWHGDWTVGLLYPFFQWSSSITQHMGQIANIERRLNWNMPAVRSMKIALTQPSDVVDAPDAVHLPPDATPEVRLEHVGHTYGGAVAEAGSLHVLKDVGFTVAPGEKVALIGPSGAGKTTVMRLLQRYMDPEQGGILIGGTDLRKVRLADWTRLIGYIPQEAQVLDGSIRYNLLYGLPEDEAAKVTDDELWEVMHKLRIDFGERLTEGLDTVVGRRGIKLSGGQAQRLMIGAAVLKHPRFLIVDEATSSLDSTTELQVQEGLRQVLRSETSALIIAHRLSTVRHLCTKFVVLRQAEQAPQEEGQVEAVAGSFEELYASSPTFRRLADDQGVTVVPAVDPVSGEEPASVCSGRPAAGPSLQRVGAC